MQLMFNLHASAAAIASGKFKITLKLCFKMNKFVIMVLIGNCTCSRSINEK